MDPSNFRVAVPLSFTESMYFWISSLETLSLKTMIYSDEGQQAHYWKPGEWTHCQTCYIALSIWLELMVREMVSRTTPGFGQDKVIHGNGPQHERRADSMCGIVDCGLVSALVKLALESEFNKSLPIPHIIIHHPTSVPVNLGASARILRPLSGPIRR